MNAVLCILDPSVDKYDFTRTIFPLETTILLITTVKINHTATECLVIPDAEHRQDEVKETILAWHKKYSISHIYNNDEMLVEFTAAVASELNLHTNLSKETAKFYRNKLEMRNRLVKSNLKTLPFCDVNTSEDVKQFLNKYSFPCIVRPVDECSSNGIHVIRNWEDYYKYAPEINQSHYKQFCERFLEKPQMYLCNGFAANGKVTNLWPMQGVGTQLDLFENAISCGRISILPSDAEFAKLKIFCESIIKAISAPKHLTFHMELFKVNGEFFLCEIAARKPGGTLCWMVDQSEEIPYLFFHMDVYLSLGLQPILNPGSELKRKRTCEWAIPSNQHGSHQEISEKIHRMHFQINGTLENAVIEMPKVLAEEKKRRGAKNVDSKPREKPILNSKEDVELAVGESAGNRCYLSVTAWSVLLFSRLSMGVLVGSFASISSLFYISSAITALGTGWITDRYGWNFTMVKISAMIAIASCFLVYQTTFTSGNQAVMAVLGIANTMSFVSVTEKLMKHTQISSRGRIMGWIEASYSLGLFIGLSISGMLVTYPTTLFSMVALMAVSLGFSFLLRGQSLQQGNSESVVGIFKSGKAVYLLLLTAIASSIFALSESMLTQNVLNIQSVSPTTIDSIFYLVYTVIAVSLGQVAHSSTKNTFLALGTVVGLTGTFGLSYSTTAALSIVMALLTCSGIALFQITMIPTVLQLGTNTNQSGRLIGLTYLFTCLGGLLTSAIFSAEPNYKSVVGSLGGALLLFQVISYSKVIYKSITSN
ncbi:hypothetical protein HDV01_001379 [Terramyces sp. JEL0728]|nr:hypothetical protein HDV01_001379 [Terramyces sp. JEL0728]